VTYHYGDAVPHHHGVAWGNVPEFIAAIATSFAFVAASFAARWAKRAADATTKAAEGAQAQALAAQDQAKTAREQADAALAGMEGQRVRADRTHRLAMEQRLDAGAPVVVGKAFPGYRVPGPVPIERSMVSFTSRQYAREIPADGILHDAWVPIPEAGQVLPGPPVAEPYDIFQLVVTLHFSNYGAVPARIALTGRDSYEIVDWPQGAELYLAPSESKTIHLVRRVSATIAVDHLLSGQLDEDLDLMDLEYLVRDLATNVTDTYRFSADLRVFRVFAGVIRAMPEPERCWGENVAGPIRSRTYDRLDASNASS
jgi:hypothetical protein